MAQFYRVTVLDNRIISLVQPGGDVNRWTYGTAKKIERRARIIAPKRSGRLAASHVTLPTTGSNAYQTRYRISANAYYALYVHEGTGLYGKYRRLIRRPRGKMGPLTGAGPRFIWFHRGQRGQDWLADAAWYVAGSI